MQLTPAQFRGGGGGDDYCPSPQIQAMHDEHSSGHRVVEVTSNSPLDFFQVAAPFFLFQLTTDRGSCQELTLPDIPGHSGFHLPDISLGCPVPGVFSLLPPIIRLSDWHFSFP